MRVLAAVAPSEVHARLVDEMAELVAETLAHDHSTAATSADVEAVCRGYQRELWLWVVGERTWAQCVSGLSGRLERRSTVPG